MRATIAALCTLLVSIPPLFGADSSKAAEAVYANIRVLQGVPSSQLLPIMHFMRASLGVGCEFCHVTEDDQYRLDVKKQKERAREMILMTRRLNELSFGGRNVVTCETCHRGAVVTNSVPQIRSVAPESPALPPVSEILRRFDEATRFDRLAPVRMTIEGCRAKIIAAGTPDRLIIPRADCSRRELMIDGDKSATTSSLPNGECVRAGSDGRHGWIVTGSHLHWIADEEFAQWQRSLNPLLAARVMPDDLSSSRVEAMDTIRGQETYRIESVGRDGTAQTLWFSKATGLLVRRTYYRAMALGLDPEQFDLSNYRRFGQVTFPAHINTSYLDDRHLGVLRIIRAVNHAKPGSEVFAPPDGARN